MKLVSFDGPRGRGFGIFAANGVVDVSAHLPGATDLATALADPLQLERLASRDPDYEISEVRLTCPIPDARRIVGVGLNYRAHAAETGSPLPRHPPLFLRDSASLVAPGENLVRPRVSQMFDFEGELAVVIGRGGRAVQVAQALDHVAGYACFNDGSVRDFQRHTTQVVPGKNFWRSGSFGPWLVTPDEVGDVANLQLTTRLNGNVVQRSGLDDLIFDVPSQIAYISQIFELRPGDVIATGTPSGVGAARKPPMWLQPGDLLEIEIDKLGILANRVVAEESLS